MSDLARALCRAALLVLLALGAACSVPLGAEARMATDEGLASDARYEASGRADSKAPQRNKDASRAVPVLAGVPIVGALFRQSDQAPAPTERMMIRTGEVGVEVPRAEEAVRECQELVAGYGGYLSRRDGSRLTCRVPAMRFDDFVAAVKGMGRVLHESMQALDVTDQHRDLAIRLDNAQRSRERLLALLEQAEKVEDLLKIENELRRLTEEIERMTAELQSLESRVALSTIVVSFSSVERVDKTDVRRRPSRFYWINAVGAEHVLRRF